MKNQELSLKANMIWNSFGSLVNLGCQWLITILIVRMGSGYEAAGVFSLAMSVYNIFAPIGQYRMYTYQVTDVNNENSTGEYLSFRHITNGVALLLCMGYSLITCDHEALAAIFLYTVYKSACLVIDVFHACDQRHHRMDYIGQSLALQGVFSLGSFIIVFWATASLEFALLAMTIAVMLVGTVFDWPRVQQFGPIETSISIAKVRHLAIRCLPIVVASIAAAAAPSLPRQYLSSVSGDAMLGIYAAAAAPVALIQTGASYIYNPLLGYFSERFAARDKRGFNGLFAKTTLGIIALGLLCSAGVMGFGEPLLVLVYGSKMSGYGYLLPPLVVLALFTGYMWFVNDLLMAVRNFRGAFLGNAVALLVSVACLPLIGVWGMDGVTLTCLASCLTGILVMAASLIIQLWGYWPR